MSTNELTLKQKSDAQKDIVQAIAVKRIVKHFKSNNRGQLAMFCGTGKTRTAIKAIKSLKSRVVVVCVPTLGLASQWINDFAKYGDKRELLAVCSKLHNETPEDYGIVGYTTNKEVVRAFAKSTGKSLIVSTYQSYDVIQAAWRRTKLAPIDLLVADEAHNTAGKNSKHMGLCLHDSGAKVVNRLFMTATRRLYRGDKDEYNCMDDTSVYGDVIYELTLREAIDRGIVSDYAVYVINVYKDLRPEDFANINSRGFESELLAKFVSEKIMNDKAVRVFTFHNRVDDATEFADHIEASGKWAKVLTGEQKVADREATLRAFETHQRSSLIASVNVLGEGIDVPSVDVIVFADRMAEPQAIIQRIGRGTRVVDGKNKLRIILPICVAPNMSDTEVNHVADVSRHKDVLNVIRALASYDPNFYQRVDAIDQSRRDLSELKYCDANHAEDRLLWFDVDCLQAFNARILSPKPWPEITEGIPEIEESIRQYLSSMGTPPSGASGSHLCPVSFSTWASVNQYLVMKTDYTLSWLCESTTGIVRRMPDKSQEIVLAFDSFLQTHGRPPKPSDGSDMAPDSFKTWKKAGAYLSSRRKDTLSKLAEKRGFPSRKTKVECTVRLRQQARKKLRLYFRQYGRLPPRDDIFLKGRSFQWFTKEFPEIYRQLRMEIGSLRLLDESEIVRSIQAFVKKNNRPPLTEELRDEYAWSIRNEVKWCDLLNLAGTCTAGESRLMDRASVIANEVIAFIKEHGRRPSSKVDMQNQAKFVNYNKPFGISSWPRFIEHVLSLGKSQHATASCE